MAGVAPLGEMLLARGLISRDQLRIALIEQKASLHPLGRQLVQLGFISDSRLRETLAERLGHPTIDLLHAVVDRHALHHVPRELARRHLVMPVALRAERSTLVLAMANPDDLSTLDQVRMRLQGELAIEVVLAAESDILRAIDRYYGFELSIDGILHEMETGEADGGAGFYPGVEEYSQPVVRLVDALLADAVLRGASDLHFEPEPAFVRIRYRIDGVLREVRCLHRSCWPGMLVRLKVLCGMNIAESRAPQDGRLSLDLLGRAVDFRAASHPGMGGENLVLRILDRQKGLLALHELGLAPDTLDLLLRLMACPEGLVLVTGPTGSGKTTTLYSMLAHINQVGLNIMTLEDPVEYPLALLRQTSMGEGNKMDFASGIRSMMRQDPDVILVGEIRDRDTAEMALRASMTGHQVFSTLHCNSAVRAIPRLLDLGMRPEIMASCLCGIIAQRLVRRLCPACRQSTTCSTALYHQLGLPSAAERPVYRARGCAVCEHQGYAGRFSVLEVLTIDDEMAEMVAASCSTRELLRTALRKGFRPLAQEGLRHVLDGNTSIEELGRVIDLGLREA